MDYNPLNELEERFNRFLDAVKADSGQPYAISAHKALGEYVLFIDETTPLNIVAFEIYDSRGIAAILDKVREGYKNKGLTFDPGDIPFIKNFHHRVVEAAEKKGFTKKEIIMLNSNEALIYLSSDPSRCYSVKGERPKRYAIVQYLWRNDPTAQSARGLARHIYRNDEAALQNLVRREIVGINKMFMSRVYNEELISHQLRRGKNMYFLNTEDFLFQEQK